MTLSVQAFERSCWRKLRKVVVTFGIMIISTVDWSSVCWSSVDGYKSIRKLLEFNFSVPFSLGSRVGWFLASHSALATTFDAPSFVQWSCDYLAFGKGCSYCVGNLCYVRGHSRLQSDKHVDAKSNFEVPSSPVGGFCRITRYPCREWRNKRNV